MHDCPNSRSIGYFLEPLLLLALFSKKVRARAHEGMHWRALLLSVRAAAGGGSMQHQGQTTLLISIPQCSSRLSRFLQALIAFLAIFPPVTPLQLPAAAAEHNTAWHHQRRSRPLG